MIDATEIERRLRDEVVVLAERFHVPGVAFAADIDGAVIDAHHGITHTEHPLPITGDTLFQIASMSKPFAATIVMMLVEEGLAGLDDAVRDHVPDFATAGGSHDTDVTIRHLLTHTTGWDGDELLARPVVGGVLADAPRVMAGARQLVPPGTDFTYNNGGFAIAGRLVENITGRPFATELRERVLDPLGLRHTATSADEAIMHRVAMRHQVKRGVVTALYEAGWQPGWGLDPIDLPVGGLISTTNDLLAWMRCWLQRGDTDSLGLTRSTRATMLDPASGWFNPTTAQGIGWALRRHPGGLVHGHGGLTVGYCSYSLFCPELDLAAVILTNSTSGTALCTALAERIVADVSGVPWELPETPTDPPDPSRVVGQYTGSFGVITVSADGDELTLSNERHRTDDGRWQPDPEPARTAVLYAPQHAIVTGPPTYAGTLVDVSPTPADGRPAWIRSGGRIHTRLE